MSIKHGKRRFPRDHKHHTLRPFNMRDVAAATDFNLRTLQRFCKKHHLDPRDMSLLDLARLIEILNPAVPVASSDEQSAPQSSQPEEGPF